MIIQTLRPKSPVIRQAAAHDIAGFYRDELACRAEQGFPPFRRLLRLVLRSKNQQAARDWADALAERLRNSINAGSIGAPVELLGPAECPLAMVAGNARYHLLLRSDGAGPGRAALLAAMEGWRSPAGVHLEIDPDPVSLL